MTRMIANVEAENCNAVRLMICDKKQEGVFVFGYADSKDSACSWDCHYDDLEDAFEMGEDYGINKNDWVTIAPTLDGCQDDWISVVRVKGRHTGKPQWGKFEKLVNDNWVDL